MEVIAPWMNEELTLFREVAERFVTERMVPQDARWRREHSVGHEIWREAGEVGLLCTDIPLEYGGGGGDFRHESIVHDALSRRGLVGFATGVHSICAQYVNRHGTHEQKQRWLPRLARGELVGAIAMTEPGTGSDLQAIRMTARRDGQHYVINGAKTFITNGSLAGLLALVVKTDPTQRASGMSILMVETADLPGYRVGAVLDKMGMQAQDTSLLFFEDVRVPVDCLLGGVAGKGFHQLMSDLPYERAVIAVSGVAAMEGAIEETLRYVKERSAFGKPVFEFQNTKFELAEVATIARIARVFVNDCIQRVVDGSLDSTTAAMAKWWITDMQQQVIDRCLQLHGGYGYMNETLVCRMFADARVQRIYGGTNEIMKELISRAL
ncbi:acyl-CoA dehydrogenase family protein [Peristeroidobacter soli]|jgi:acyl-CoA dehydrogenase|uniref:acyl-CoA dehydrogenase family protein n=1 Tax=Peristeroidobacter soli TaxID=2497877 RepID=UPI00101B8751|nr:acyl-CoA dehydrogenase family protein [Peristeroidobacter soli]